MNIVGPPHFLPPVSEMSGQAYERLDKKTRPSRFSIWLNEQPDDPQDYAPALPKTHNTRKRHREGGSEEIIGDGQDPQTTQAKRRKLRKGAGGGKHMTRGKPCALGEVAGNAMAGKGADGEAAAAKEQNHSTQEAVRRSARNRAPKDPKPQEDTEVIANSAGDALDGESFGEDPSLLSELWKDPPLFSPPVTKSPQRSESPSKQKSPTKQKPSISFKASTVTNSSQRSKSPTKVSDLQLGEIKLEIVAGMIIREDLPAGGQTLWNDMTAIGAGARVVPSVLEKHFRLELPYLDNIDHHLYPVCQGKGKRKVGDRVEDYEIAWKKAGKIKEKASECRNLSLAEPSWNGEVHLRILNLALAKGRKSMGVWYRDVTTTRIRDKSLKETNEQSKTVDFCLIMEDKRTQLNVIELVKAKDLQSINHADAEYLRFCPIGASIETKKAHINEIEADIQVSLWVKAHYAKLRQLAPKSQRLPILPLITTLGNDWYFMLAEIRNRNHIYIHRGESVGSTSSMLGIFKILAAIRRLAQWVYEEYRPWFETEVIKGF